ncbi:DEMETER-like protein 2 [Platanthera zijinensis]|uniref:DEMETER-like protein 2 n=1 Tax=Platanthera zijinensis TaxID=2320716 RepID=A0AAP0G089_9ASPA
MKRAAVLDDGENIPVCIAVLKDPHGSFRFEAQQQRSHGATDLNSLPVILKNSPSTAAAATDSSGDVSEAVRISCSGTQPAASEFSEAILFNLPENTLDGDKGKLGANSKKERSKKTKRKKHRPKVIEVEKPESKPRSEIPMLPQTPNQKFPGKKKSKVIGRRTFARRKNLANSLDNEDECEEAGDLPQASADEVINPSNNMQIDGDEFDAKFFVEPWKSELISENFSAGFTNNSTDVNISIDQLLQELAKLPQKAFSPLLLKEELLQLNIECPVDTLKYIVDNIRIPSLLYIFNQARRSAAGIRSKWGHKLKESLDHSSYEVLEKFMYVLKNLLPSLLLKYDSSRSAGHLINNIQGRSKRNIRRSKEPRDMSKRSFISNAYSNCQIAPYTHLQELSLRFQRMENSCPTPVTCNFTISRNILRNWKHINIPPSQCCNNTTKLDFQAVLDSFRIVDINKDCELDVSAELRNVIVPSFEGGMIIPYNGSFEQPKQKLHRVKVLLDPETNRQWKLLQENEGDKIEEMDSCKLKWWENERRVFLGRAKSFIARMNLILGDRRFSPWKGSIVDSVVGVFLTQNVSDHLSSSAFMSLAAKFPLRRRGYEGENSVSKLDECEETSAVSMTILNDIPNLSNCDDQDPMEIQLNGHPPEVLASQSYNLQNSLGSIRMESSERDMAIDMDRFVEHVANISNAFGENSQNECRGLSRVVSESIVCSNLNNHSIDTMDTEMEATTSYSNKTNAYFMLENKSLRETKENFVDEGKVDWEGMRRKVCHDGDRKERSCESLDSINWEAVWNADLKQISEAIRERGMNNLLAERIKDFLDRLVKDHGSIDLEWLRNVCPDDAKKYLLSIRGLGLKSVECVRLLALQNVAFPVDTNVARISVRLGWVPLKPLPEFLQLHLLEQYPILDSVQKYIWPRLCKLDQKELYELHYHMITFGKVFCTKSRPNCSICPMRRECKHFNSAKLALPAPENKQFKSSSFYDTSLSSCISFSPTLQLQYDENHASGVLNNNYVPIIEFPTTPIIEEPPASPPHGIVQVIDEPLPSPPHETIQIVDADIEDAFYEDDEFLK